MTLLPSLKDSSRETIIEVARELEPYFPDITSRWRERITREMQLDARAIATLERITIASGSAHFRHNDFDAFSENLSYSGTRLARINVDTRLVRRALEIYEELCEPYINSLFTDGRNEACSALGMLSSTAFAAVSAAYFDARRKESEALLAVLDVELADSKLSSMLQRTLDITCETFGAVAGAVILRDPESDLLYVESTAGLDERLRGEFNLEMGQGFCGLIAHSGEPEMVMDAGSDPRVNPMLRRVAKSLWGMPLKSEGKTIGVLMIGFPRPYEWLPTERELMRAIADRSALAIDRARMTDTLRAREARIAELSTHLLRAQEEERKRISRELHDETGQGLMVVHLYLGMLSSSLTSRPAKAKVKETLDVVDRTIEGLRRIIGYLSPLLLQELGLFAAVRKEAKDLEKNTGVKMRVAISDEVGRLGEDTETAIYRIVQEALHNIAKHAHANSACIAMNREGPSIRLSVEDDGVGIFPRSNFRGNSFGLAGIKERVGMLGGEVKVISLKGKGTRIEVTVPATKPGDILRLEPAEEGLRPMYAAVEGIHGESKAHAEN